VQLRHSGFVDADLDANLLHRGFLEIVPANHAALAWWQQRNRRTHPFSHLEGLVGLVGRRRLRRHEHWGEIRAVRFVERGQRRGGLDRVDPDNGAAQPGFVCAHSRGEISKRGFMAELAP